MSVHARFALGLLLAAAALPLAAQDLADSALQGAAGTAAEAVAAGTATSRPAAETLPAGTRAATLFPAAGSLFASVTSARHGLDTARGALADDVQNGFALGFRLTPSLSVELGGGRTATSAGTVDADIDTVRLDARWHFDTAGAWQPWVIAGLADQNVKVAGSEAGETLLAAGAGLFRHLGGPFGLRAEWRVAYGLDNETWDHLAGLGLTVAFGGDRHTR